MQSLRLDKATGSLKQLVSIVTGVTVAQSIYLFVSNGSYSSIRTFETFSPPSIIFFVLMISNLLRFYHGNMRLLDEYYSSGDNHRPPRRLDVDFFVIFGQSVLLAAMSFYVGKTREFFTLYTALLIVDVIWFFITLGFAETWLEFRRQRNWAINNVITVIALILVYANRASFSPEVYFYVLVGLIIANTLADFVISWLFYFPHLAMSNDSGAINGAINGATNGTTTGS